MTPAESLAQFAATFDRSTIVEHCSKALAERTALQKAFPRESLATMAVEKYAMGLGGNNTLCWTYEFGSDHVGSIKGGSVFKFVVWFGKDGELVSSAKKDEPNPVLAWEKLRAGLIRSLELCDAGNFAETDAVPFARLTPALRVKFQHVFYPSEVLPIFSCGHLEHFLSQLGVSWKRDREKDLYTATANRLLLGELRKLPTLADWTTTELERLLYTWNSPTQEPIALFAKTFDRAALASDAQKAAEQRAAFVHEFPLADFGKMPMSRYVAPGEAEEGMIYWLEDRTSVLGGLPTARKRVPGVEHLRDTGIFRDTFRTPEEAEPEWIRLRDAMVQGFEQAAAGNWAGVHIPPNGNPSAKRAKLLYLYFPDEFLPIQNSNEVALYLKALDLEPGDDAGAWDPVRTRLILEHLRTISELEGWMTFELAKLLEAWVMDRTRALKVAPGRDAKFWGPCLSNGTIAVGWGATGDFRNFASRSDLKTAFIRLGYGKTKGKSSEKAGELWAFGKLKPGDRVVANKGMSHVLAIGTVVEPGYDFLPVPYGDDFNHIVHVNWDTTLQKDIPPQERWGVMTVKELSRQEKALIFGGNNNTLATSEKSNPPVQITMKHTLNQILFGPPGTGKTYRVIRDAAAIASRTEFASDEDAKREFDKLCVSGRVRLATFHQSFSYEDFIEGIRPKMDEGEARFRVQDGMFKRMTTEALFACLERLPDAKAAGDFDARWDALIEEIRAFELVVIIPALSEGGEWHIEVSPEGGIMASLGAEGKKYSFSRKIFKEVWVKNFPKPTISTVDSKNAYGSGAYHSLMAAVYNYMQKKIPLKSGGGASGKIPADASKIVQDYLKFREASGWRMKAAADCPPFVLVVDEINRGNISRVFGELITLIEDDKRWGADNALMVTLPTSGELFTVPPNLYLLGTMNTADKSLAMLDVALRRRFEFVELAPDFLVCNELPPEMRTALERLNERLERRKDRDHQIGHAFFKGVRDAEGFDGVFRKKVLPLLQEYFFNDVEGARYVLGEAGNDEGFLRRIKPDGDVDKMQRNHWRWNSDTKSCWEQLRANFKL